MTVLVNNRKRELLRRVSTHSIWIIGGIKAPYIKGQLLKSGKMLIYQPISATKSAQLKINFSQIDLSINHG